MLLLAMTDCAEMISQIRHGAGAEMFRWLVAGLGAGGEREVDFMRREVRSKGTSLEV